MEITEESALCISLGLQILFMVDEDDRLQLIRPIQADAIESKGEIWTRSVYNSVISLLIGFSWTQVSLWGQIFLKYRFVRTLGKREV